MCVIYCYEICSYFQQESEEEVEEEEEVEMEIDNAEDDADNDQKHGKLELSEYRVGTLNPTHCREKLKSKWSLLRVFTPWLSLFTMKGGGTLKFFVTIPSTGQKKMVLVLNFSYYDNNLIISTSGYVGTCSIFSLAEAF